jgi:hypothetical protein
MIVYKTTNLETLHFSMLYRSASQHIVELDRLVGSSAGLVLRCLVTEPKVHVPL